MSLKNVEMKENGTAVLTIEVAPAAFVAAVEKVYRQTRGSLNVPGFRKGKAPRKVVEKMYGSGVFYEDAINELYPTALTDAEAESGLTTVGYPKLEIVTVNEKEGLIFTAEVALMPEAKLGEYKGISAPKAGVEVTDEDVETEMRPLISRGTTTVDVDRPAQMTDTVKIDFEGFKDGVAFEGGKGENYELKLGSHTFIPGFEEQIVGMSIGEEKEINVTFPEEYGAAELAGAAAVFKVKVNAITEEQTPAIDDEFAKDNGFDTLDELKADLRQKVTDRKTKAAEDAFKAAVMSKVIENAEVEVPDAMLEYELDRQMDNYIQRLKAAGLSLEQYLQMMGTNPTEFRAQNKPGVLQNIKSDLVLTAVVKAEGIEASEEEIAAEADRLAAEYNMPVDQVRASVTDDQLATAVKMDKASKLIYDSAVVEAAE